MGHHSEMDAAATCEWYMYKARKRRRAKPASVTREETKLQECEAVLAQVLGVPVGALSRLELCNTGQEAELRRRALDDPDVIVPLTLAFRHAVDARKHRAWWSSEAAAADGVHDWFRPEPQLVWRLKLMRALCSPLSHPACARAAAAAELPAMLLEVPPPTFCTLRPLHHRTQTSAASIYVRMYIGFSATTPLHRCLHFSSRLLCSHLHLHLCLQVLRAGNALVRGARWAAETAYAVHCLASLSAHADGLEQLEGFVPLVCSALRRHARPRHAHAMPMRHAHAPPRAWLGLGLVRVRVSG